MRQIDELVPGLGWVPHHCELLVAGWRGGGVVKDAGDSLDNAVNVSEVAAVFTVVKLPELARRQ